jgi:signal transduction histidine kinase
LPRELSVMAAEFAHRTGLGVRTDVVALPSNVSPEIAGALYRVAQEALANVGRHAHGNNVRVTLSVNDRSIALRVRDDGLGFPRGGSVHSRGRGIGNMRARLKEVGGTLKIGNRRRGAVVVASVDLGAQIAASAWPEVSAAPVRAPATIAT